MRLTPAGNPPLYVSAGRGRRAEEGARAERCESVDQAQLSTNSTASVYDGHALKEGEGLVVGVAIEAKEEMADALFTDLLPGGLEIENFNLSDAKQWADVVVDGMRINDRESAAEVRHEEFRDDRYVAALKLYKGQKAHVFYLVRAVSPGTFVVPAAAWSRTCIGRRFAASARASRRRSRSSSLSSSPRSRKGLR